MEILGLSKDLGVMVRNTLAYFANAAALYGSQKGSLEITLTGCKSITPPSRLLHKVQESV